MEHGYEVPIISKELCYLDLRDFYDNLDTLLVVLQISEDIRRGASHYRLDGTPLYSYREVVEALVGDGGVIMNDEDAEDEIRH